MSLLKRAALLALPLAIAACHKSTNFGDENVRPDYIKGSIVSATYDGTSNEEIKEQLIFVFSQRHESDAVEKLIDIAKRDSNPEMRKKAVFWLGQSQDPRARQVLLDIINQ